MKKIYSIDNFLHFATPSPNLPLVRGYVESLLPQGDGKSYIQVNGWLNLPDQPMDSVEVYINDRYINTYALQPRRDVQNAFPWIPHSLLSGFSFSLPLVGLNSQLITRVNLIGCWQGSKIGRFSIFTYNDIGLIELFPNPSEDYTYRVVHTRNTYFFKVSAIQTFSEFMTAACRYTDFSSVKRILDWGCGCGRLTAHFLSIIKGPEVFGCDIDPSAIEWSNNNIQSGVFSVVNPMPPTDYPDNFFDVVFSYSVFTHLTRDVQHAWLVEMQRLIKPGGIFIATTHGKLALQFAMQSVCPSIPDDGIIDTHLDTTLDGIAPKDYYRATHQTKEYTIREFGKYFNIIEYIETGAAHFQDMIIMRKI